MKYFEVEGSTPEEIIREFLIQQGVSQEYVECEVLDAGSKGILGIGKKPAKVRIKYDDVEYIKRKSRLLLSDILEKAGFGDAFIEVKDKNPDFVLNIMSNDSSILIGKSALTLDSLQYLVDRILRIEESSNVRVLVDVDNYRERVINPLVEKAVHLATGVKKTNKPVKFPPMATIARREIHIALKAIPGVSTISTGEGQIKQLSIVSEKKGGYRGNRPSNGNKPNNGNRAKQND